MGGYNYGTAGDPDQESAWQKRDPNAPTFPGAPNQGANSAPSTGYVRQDANGMVSDPAGNTPSISHANYVWGGREGAGDEDVRMLGMENDAAQSRGATQMDNRRADAALVRDIAARRDQQYMSGLYRASLAGQTPSAANIASRAAGDQNIAAQMGAAGQGTSDAQVGAAQSAATAQGQRAMLAANQQFAGARAAENAAAVSGYARNSEAARAADLTNAGMSQEQALHQAQLEAAQRARNDEMARFYVGQQNDIRRQELTGSQAYEAQRDANYTAAIQDYQRRAQREQERKIGYIVNYANAIGTGASMAAKAG